VVQAHPVALVAPGSCSIRRSQQLTRGKTRLVASTVVLAIVASSAGADLAEQLGRSLSKN
jgi:hypothetical protein